MRHPLKWIGGQSATPLRIWAVSDGRSGIENQVLGLSEAVARLNPAEISVKRAVLRTPWRWLPAGLIPAPRAATTTESDTFAPPWPDLWIASGRHSRPLSMGVRGWSRGQTFVVQLQDPRINPLEFDLVVPSTHDELEGENVFPILGSVSRVTPQRIADAAATYPRVLSASPAPLIGVLIGGRSRRMDISAARATELAAQLLKLKEDTGGSLLVTLSRRTGAAARRVFAAALAKDAALYYDGVGPNPYFALLEAADIVIVTADSVNMAAEAAAAGKPVLLAPVDGYSPKHARFADALIARGFARRFTGEFETWRQQMLTETDRVAAEVLRRIARRADSLPPNAARG